MVEEGGLIEATSRFLFKTGGIIVGKYLSPNSHQLIANIIVADYHAPLMLIPDMLFYVLAKRVLFNTKFNDNRGGAGISVPKAMLEEARFKGALIVHYYKEKFYEYPSTEWLKNGEFREDGFPDPDVGLPFSTLKEMQF